MHQRCRRRKEHRWTATVAAFGDPQIIEPRHEARVAQSRVVEQPLHEGPLGVGELSWIDLHTTFIPSVGVTPEQWRVVHGEWRATHHAPLATQHSRRITPP